MRKFDIETYNEYRTGNRTYYRYSKTDDNGDSIEITLEDFNAKKYLEYIIYINLPIKKYYEYNKKTLNMIFESETFYDCAIGFRREYDDNGALIKEIDNDAPFKFTWQDLVEKMRQDYAIELWDKQTKEYKGGTNVSRGGQPLCYGVSIYREFIPEYGGWTKERFIIDGTTGKLVGHSGNDAREHPEDKKKQ